MQNCLGELNLTYTLIYLDHVIIYSRTEETPHPLAGCLGEIHGEWPEAKVI